MTRQPGSIEDGDSGRNQIDPFQQAHTLIRLIPNYFFQPRNPWPQFHPPVPTIPRTSPERLALASPDSPDDASASTVLYLAYGSNLSSAVLKRRDVKPVSQINVSAPGLDLAFDLPGLPYWEPCFANVTPRKIPKPPIPGDPPKPPFDPPSAGYYGQYEISEEDEEYSGAFLPALPPGIPSWNKGLYGVVYELTRDDYRKIIQTEGGGTAYKDILTPVLALPPPLNIPEKPPIPELPKPFLAHTLYAPRLPSFTPPSNGNRNDDNENEGSRSDGDDDPRDKKWWQKLLLPVHRPDPDYAQPSARYLNLIREGARQHYLPDDYQLYLARLQWYQITTWRQEIGRWLFLLLVLPFFAIIQGLSYFFADKEGRAPKWLGIASIVFFNLMWRVYDKVFKPVFGDGERTIEEEDDSNNYGDMRQGGIFYTHVWEDEKSALFADW
ncbi:hypothetical protein F5Y06DRAFT_256880 [Hypoxylon sp. FL0890]|nr:hypothetical protein F5Y06DRAFT_256880 [Hypoxylon sp. FL0890]